MSGSQAAPVNPGQAMMAGVYSSGRVPVEQMHEGATLSLNSFSKIMSSCVS